MLAGATRWDDTPLLHDTTSPRTFAPSVNVKSESHFSRFPTWISGAIMGCALQHPACVQALSLLLFRDTAVWVSTGIIQWPWHFRPFEALLFYFSSSSAELRVISRYEHR